MNWRVLCIQALLGANVPMTGQIVPDNWTTTPDGQGVMIDLSPMNEAIRRWQRAAFATWEGEYSTRWRTETASLSFGSLEGVLRQNAFIIPPPPSPDALMVVVDEVLATPAAQELLLTWIVGQVRPSAVEKEHIASRWNQGSDRRLVTFAPYAHHCMRALVALIAAVRHKMLRWESTLYLDLQYLFYLPFCNVLFSEDRSHRTLAPGLLRADQAFARLEPLKADLRRLSDIAEKLTPDEARRRSFSHNSYPVPAANSIVWGLWRRYCSPWSPRMVNVASQLPPEEKALAIAEASALFAPFQS